MTTRPPRPYLPVDETDDHPWLRLGGLLIALLFVFALHVVVVGVLSLRFVTGDAPEQSLASAPLTLEPPPFEMDLDPIETVPSAVLAPIPDEIADPTATSQPAEPAPPTPNEDASKPEDAPETDDDENESEPPEPETPDNAETQVKPPPPKPEPPKTGPPKKEPRKQEAPKQTEARPIRPQQAQPNQPRSMAMLPPPGAAPGGSRSVRDSWQSRVMVHLDNRKRYPAVAVSRREEGDATVRFVVDRQGRVLSVQLVRSTGYMLLDKEIHELFKRAQPLPPPPPDVQGHQVEITASIRFKIY